MGMVWVVREIGGHMTLKMEKDNTGDPSSHIWYSRQYPDDVQLRPVALPDNLCRTASGLFKNMLVLRRQQLIKGVIATITDGPGINFALECFRTGARRQIRQRRRGNKVLSGHF
jgi:hypothetical protein